MAAGATDPKEMLWLFAQQTREHAIVAMDPGGVITWFSPGASHIFGHAENEVVGQPSSVLFTREDVERGMNRLELEVAAADGISEDDRWQQRADGTRFWASGMVLAVRGPSQELLGYVKLLRNRSALRAQIDGLSNQVRALDLDSQRKDIFLSTLSHELRNPLAPLSNAVRIIRGSGTRPGSEVEYALRIVERQTELLQRLVDDLMDLARVNSGKMDVQHQRVVLNDVLSQAEQSVRPLIERREHRFDLHLPGTPIEVDGDADRLLQVFVNLFNNAAKYTPKGGRVWVHATIEGAEAVVHVHDTGLGIPIDMQPRIFDLFTQVDATKAYSQGGLGIGLTLVKNLVMLHGGDVEAKSEGEGKGSQFTVRLPLSRAG